MKTCISENSRQSLGFTNSKDGEVSSVTWLEFLNKGEQVYANHSGGGFDDGLLIGSLCPRCRRPMVIRRIHRLAPFFWMFEIMI